VTKAIGKLDKYFSGNWNGLLLATAVALDPRSKFVFWEKTTFQQRDIDAGKETVRLAWQDFRPSIAPPPTDSAQMLFQQGIVQQDEFTDYITDRLSPATDAFDVLYYWKIREVAYPNLSKLVRKHMAVCASSTPRVLFYHRKKQTINSEEGEKTRSFSQARLFAPHLRNRLKPKLFRISMLLWSMKRLLDADNM
jgi:hAT family C-terminal dimerisation region